MTDAEIKLLQAKCSLYSDISDAKRQIDYHVTEGAKEVRELLQSAKNIKTDSATLTKDQYDSILNYLLSIEHNAIHNFKNKSYLSKYYLEIELKTQILNKL